jgi:hypothetical protein
LQRRGGAAAHAPIDKIAFARGFGLKSGTEWTLRDQ